jgi:hypothetical protein
LEETKSSRKKAYVIAEFLNLVERHRGKLGAGRATRGVLAWRCEIEATMATTKPPIIGTALSAWADTFRMIAAMPLVFGIALGLAIALSLITLAIVPDPVAFATSGQLDAALLVVVPSILNAIVFAPLAIVAHRYVLLGETTNRYPLDPFSARYVRFVGFAILFKLALVLPNALLGLETALPAAGAFQFATGVAAVFVYIVAIRRLILFPAIAIDAPGATWSNARRDTKGISWRVLFIFVCTALPQLIVSAPIGLLMLNPEFEGASWLALSLIPVIVGIPTICAFAAAASHIFRARAESLTRAAG